MENPNIPPGLTGDQYYVYLASGHTYSPSQGIMYLASQLAPENQLERIHPVRIHKDETAHWLFNKHYYDLAARTWRKAHFTVPTEVVDRIWNEARNSALTALQLNDEITKLMSCLQMTPSPPSTEPTEAPKPRQTKIGSKLATKKNGKMELNKVQAVESKHKSRRSEMKKKIKTLPSTVALNSEFWQSVL